MDTCPLCCAVSKPLLEMVASALGVALHDTTDVRSWVELSLKVPVALSCSVWSTTRFEFVGPTLMETKVAGVVLMVLLWEDTVQPVANAREAKHSTIRAVRVGVTVVVFIRRGRKHDWNQNPACKSLILSTWIAVGSCARGNKEKIIAVCQRKYFHAAKVRN